MSLANLEKSFSVAIQPQATDVEAESVHPAKPQPRAPRRTRVAPSTSTRGKSSNPDYEAVKVLIHSEKRTRATRKWQDEQGRGRDFSDLIDTLLTKYLGS